MFIIWKGIHECVKYGNMLNTVEKTTLLMVKSRIPKQFIIDCLCQFGSWEIRGWIKLSLR